MVSNEMLQAFVHAASHGSFSAAAKVLGKRQSTISEAIAGLEIDLGVQLFDRSTRKPGLTLAGQVMLQRAQDILAANDRLTLAARQLNEGLEPRLTVVLSDTYQSDRFEAALVGLEQRYPHLQLECLIAEQADLLMLLQRGRAQIAFSEQQPRYPAELAHATVAERTEFALFVHREHALAGRSGLTRQALGEYRELRLATIVESPPTTSSSNCWSASSYLLLLEMAQRGVGWAALPRWLVARFDNGSLLELTVRGWPRPVAVDVVWSRLHPPGPAGSWLLGRMLE